MNGWIIHLRRAKFDLEAVDNHAAISDWMRASTLIRRAARPPKERSQRVLVVIRLSWKRCPRKMAWEEFVLEECGACYRLTPFWPTGVLNNRNLLVRGKDVDSRDKRPGT